ncbi:helix-turn-helix domain-containing protein [Bacteroides rodentium]
MNNLYHIIAWVLIAISALDGTSARAESGTHTLTADVPLPDSLITDDYVYEYTFSDFDKAVRIMAELRKRNTLPPFRLDITEGDLYFNTGRYLQALKFYRRVLESDSVRHDDRRYMEQVHRMISCYDCLHDETKKAGYVRLLLKKAEECGSMEMKSIALFNMGKMLYYQEDKQRGYELIREAISLMKQADYKYKYDNLRYNYNSLLVMQQRDKRYEDALLTLDELDKVVTEATHEEPGIDHLAEKEKKTMYAQRAVLLSKVGRMREADEAYRAWENIGKAYTKDDYLIVPYLMDRKMYDKVIEMYTPRETFLRANRDTVNYHMIAVKRSLGRAYEGKKDYKRAARYYEQLAILTDSLKAREQKSSAIELATVYETNEREAELLERTRQVKIRNVILVSGGILLLALSVLFVRNAQHVRTVRRKNGTMVKTIQELLSQKKELYEARERIRILSESKYPAPEYTGMPDKAHPADETDPDTSATAKKPDGMEMLDTVNVPDAAIRMTGSAGIAADTDTDADATTDMDAGTSGRNGHPVTPEEEDNRRLFEELDGIVTREKLFLNPDLSRDELAKLIYVNKNRFGNILQQNAGMNATGYLNNKRLEYATKLMEENPLFTVTAIAVACGIPNVPTFHRLFRGKFGMTPAEYKKELKSAEKDAKADENGQSDTYL